ncbi:hypothetical protein [Reichenbachiella sp. MSK19-1]|uniref:hypothetical protein n=1 Tax=Reichenbachiella sp. MSK19-1 TaxID=1897631 RepID=UPI000E6D4F4A|nr:hypothetical protein [Reichenbachiella sp. MSK19-1]RJE75723.1 hypothetical protein BGP76_11560 [Reichenbachiella sp. MSK19-1]
MNKTLSLALIFDFTYSLESFTLFDIGHQKPYFKPIQSEENFMIAYQGQHRETLHEAVQLTTQDDTPISLYLSGSFITLMSKFDPETITLIKNALKQGKLSLLGGTYHHSLASIYSFKEFISDIKTHQKLLKSTFDYHTSYFYNTENIYCNDIADTLHELGYKGLFAGTIEWYLWKNKEMRLFHATNQPEQSVFLLDNDRGDSLFSDPDRHTHFLQFDPQTISSFGGLKSIVQKARQKAKILSLDEQVINTQDTTPYNIKSPVMGSVRGLSLESFHSNALQNRALKEYYKLEDPVKKTKDPDMLHDWASLGNIQYFLQMSKDEDQHLLPYDYYNIYMNILNDFTLRLIK